MSEPVWVLLTQAADRLTELASTAIDGPWQANRQTQNVESETAMVAYDIWSEGSQDWIAMMSPVVAAPLVEWLRASHARAEQQAGDVPEPLFWGVFWKDHRHAVDFARAVLGVDRG